MEERFSVRLDFAVGGSPSRFMRHEADWERFYRFVEYVASVEAGERPSEQDVRAAIAAALPRREEWVDELVAAYRHGLALLDNVRERADSPGGRRYRSASS